MAKELPSHLTHRHARHVKKVNLVLPCDTFFSVMHNILLSWWVVVSGIRKSTKKKKKTSFQSENEIHIFSPKIKCIFSATFGHILFQNNKAGVLKISPPLGIRLGLIRVLHAGQLIVCKCEIQHFERTACRASTFRVRALFSFEFSVSIFEHICGTISGTTYVPQIF